MKICPFCAEEIQDDAIKCKHCNEFLGEKIKWYFKTTFIVIALLCVGPLALPLIWLHPKTTRAWKIGLTIGISVLSWYLFQATLESMKALDEYYKLMGSL